MMPGKRTFILLLTVATGVGAAPARNTRVFYVPVSAAEIGRKLRDTEAVPLNREWSYRVCKGGVLPRTTGPGTYFVDPGGEITDATGVVVIVRRGGVLRDSLNCEVHYEKGASVPKAADRNNKLIEYDSISFEPVEPFTLKGTVTDGRGKPVPRVPVLAVSHNGMCLARVASDDDGRFEFRAAREVLCLMAGKWPDRADEWAVIHEGTRERRLRLRAVRGWPFGVKDGSWARDAKVRLVLPDTGALAVNELRRLPKPAKDDRRPRAVRRAELWCMQASALALSADHKLASAGRRDGKVRLWDLRTGRELHVLAGYFGAMAGLAFSPDGRTLASAGPDNTFFLWDVRTGRRLHSLRGHGGGVTCFAFSPDGRTLAVGCFDGFVQVWDPGTGKVRKEFRAHKDAVESLLFTAGERDIRDGNVYISCSDVVRQWDPATGREVRHFAGAASTVALSSDGRLLASAGFVQTVRDIAGGIIADGYELLCVWDARTGKELFRRKGVGGRVAFSPDGRLLTTFDQEGTLRLTEVATGKEVLATPVPQWLVTASALSPDGRSLASGRLDGPVSVWDVDPDHLFLPEPARGLNQLWADLASEDAGRAYRAIRSLTDGRQAAVRFLKDRLRPAPVRDLPLRRLIAELDDERFSVRQAASRQLITIGPPAEAALRQALEGKPSLEVRKRIDAVLAAIPAVVTAPEEARQVRAIGVLERIGSPEAREVLEALARGWPAARQTREAKDALKRLPR